MSNSLYKPEEINIFSNKPDEIINLYFGNDTDLASVEDKHLRLKKAKQDSYLTEFTEVCILNIIGGSLYKFATIVDTNKKYYEIKMDLFASVAAIYKKHDFLDVILKNENVIFLKTFAICLKLKEKKFYDYAIKIIKMPKFLAHIFQLPNLYEITYNICKSEKYILVNYYKKKMNELIPEEAKKYEHIFKL